MKISYLFPIFGEDDAKIFFTKFVKTKFFLSHSDFQMLIYLSEKDDKNSKYISRLAKKYHGVEIFKLPKNFSYNDAFYSCLKNIKGECLFLGDIKIPRVDLVFDKCESKYKGGAKIVLVRLKRTGIKGKSIASREKILNFFNKLYTGRRDSFNVTSLGFYDKDVLDLLKELPRRACFLKNTKDYYGFKVKTIYIGEDTKVYKPKFKETFALKIAISSLVLLSLSLFAVGLVNILVRSDLTTFNILMTLTILVFIIIPCLTLPKHFFDIRNGLYILDKNKGEKQNES